MDEKELEKILVESIPNRKNLSKAELEAKKQSILNDAYKISSELNNKTEQISIFFVGIFFGILGGLWANIIFTFFPGHQVLFIAILAVLSIFLFVKFIDPFIKNINKGMEENPYLKAVWKVMDAQRPERNKNLYYVLGAFFGLVLIGGSVLIYEPNRFLYLKNILITLVQLGMTRL